MIRFEVTQEKISAEVKKEKPVDMLVRDTVLLKIQGKSAYEVALENGFEGSEAEWLDSLTGPPGMPGKDGIPGQPGKDGYTPIKGVDYFDGADGKDGYTPVRGKDYWTDADKAEMVASVISSLPVYNGEAVDV